jgi:hypothetical protein
MEGSTMDKYVVSQELSEKLKGAGYPQNAQYYWGRFSPDQELKLSTHPDWVDNKESVNQAVKLGIEFYVAPLTDELLGQLPKFVMDKQMRHADKHQCPSCTCEAEYKCLLEIRRNAIAYVSDLHHRAIPYYESYERLPDALAQLWLWCKENGYLEATNG